NRSFRLTLRNSNPLNSLRFSRRIEPWLWIPETLGLSIGITFLARYIYSQKTSYLEGQSSRLSTGVCASSMAGPTSKRRSSRRPLGSRASRWGSWSADFYTGKRMVSRWNEDDRTIAECDDSERSHTK